MNQSFGADWEDTGDRLTAAARLALLHDCAAHETQGYASINQGELM
ncbi:hypothetical protein X759_16395 [Mesorhizobium sp. LSHC420B00]|nr:hypothetical protein X759_16395 [Mesorhizobium sp. LSHC420B00]